MQGRIREAFQEAMAERAADPAALERAARRFFETLVRAHRKGEGAAYT